MMDHLRTRTGLLASYLSSALVVLFVNDCCKVVKKTEVVDY